MTGAKIHFIELALALVLGSNLPASAQGTMRFSNSGAEINYPILIPSGDRAQPSDNVLADLYYGADALSATNAIGLQVQVGAGNPGYFFETSPGNRFGVVVPGHFAGEDVFAKIVAWQGGSSYATATVRRGESPLAVLRLSGGSSPDYAIPLGTGTIQLQAIPEPRPLELAVLGASVMLLRPLTRVIGSHRSWRSVRQLKLTVL